MGIMNLWIRKFYWGNFTINSFIPHSTFLIPHSSATQTNNLSVKATPCHLSLHRRGNRSLSIPTFLYYRILHGKIPIIPHSPFPIPHWAKPFITNYLSFGIFKCLRLFEGFKIFAAFFLALFKVKVKIISAFFSALAENGAVVFDYIFKYSFRNCKGFFVICVSD